MKHDEEWLKALEEKAFASSGFYRWCRSEGVKPDLSIDLMMADAYAEHMAAPLLAEIERLKNEIQASRQGFTVAGDEPVEITGCSASD